jgi:hypothetical protein
MTSLTFTTKHFQLIYDTEKLTLILLLIVGTVSKYTVYDVSEKKNLTPLFWVSMNRKRMYPSIIKMEATRYSETYKTHPLLHGKNTQQR